MVIDSRLCCVGKPQKSSRALCGNVAMNVSHSARHLRDRQGALRSLATPRSDGSKAAAEDTDNAEDTGLGSRRRRPSRRRSPWHHPRSRPPPCRTPCPSWSTCRAVLSVLPFLPFLSFVAFAATVFLLPVAPAAPAARSTAAQSRAEYGHARSTVTSEQLCHIWLLSSQSHRHPSTYSPAGRSAGMRTWSTIAMLV